MELTDHMRRQLNKAGLKVCTRCRKARPPEAFGVQKRAGRATYLKSACLDCARLKDRLRRWHGSVVMKDAPPPAFDVLERKKLRTKLSLRTRRARVKGTEIKSTALVKLLKSRAKARRKLVLIEDEINRILVAEGQQRRDSCLKQNRSL